LEAVVGAKTDVGRSRRRPAGGREGSTKGGERQKEGLVCTETELKDSEDKMRGEEGNQKKRQAWPANEGSRSVTKSKSPG
jgi:hypothetical protein